MAVSRGKTRRKTTKQPAPKAPQKESLKNAKKENKPSFWHHMFSVRGDSRSVASHPEFSTSPGVRLLPILTGLLGLLVLFTVYQLGKVDTTCGLNYISTIGTVKYLPVMSPKYQNSSALFSFIPS